MKYYKKPNGTLIEYDPNNHDEESLKDRFEECDKMEIKLKRNQRLKRKNK